MPMLPDSSSDEDDDRCGFGLNREVIDYQDMDDQSDAWSSRQSPHTSRTQSAQPPDKIGLSSTSTDLEEHTMNANNTASKHTMNITNTASKHTMNTNNTVTKHGKPASLSHEGNSPNVEIGLTPQCSGTEEITSDDLDQKPCQGSILPHEQAEELKEQCISQDVEDVVLEKPPRLNTMSSVHKNGCQLSGKARLDRPTSVKTVHGVSRYQMKRYSDWDLDEYLDGFQWGNSSTLRTLNPPTYSGTCHSAIRHLGSKLGALRNSSDNAEILSTKDLDSQGSPSHSPSQDTIAWGQSPRQLSVQSLCATAGETMQHLPADDSKMAQSKGEQKGSRKWQERLLSSTFRNSKDSASSSTAAPDPEEPDDVQKRTGAGASSFLGRVNDDDVYTITGQSLRLEASARKKGDDTPGTPSPTRFLRQLPKFVHTKAHVSQSDPYSIDQASPLMQRPDRRFGACEDVLASDTSSMMSFSSVSVEGRSPFEEVSRSPPGREEREGYKVKAISDIDTEFNYLRISCQKGSPFSRISDESADSKSRDNAGSVQCKDQSRKLFTAKFFNRMGQKGNMSNVTHVSHVYKGTILVTDLLGGKLLHLARSGRVIKWFDLGQGSEPWCACVTPLGHVAVTLRHPACLTVWSGNGTLLQEFGHDLLQSPTGLACDHQGCFIVADERTNRVLVFSPDGHFLRYLSQTPSPDSKREPGQPVLINKSKTDTGNSRVRDNKSVNAGRMDKTDKCQNPDPVKTKKKVRIYEDTTEIQDMDSEESVVQEESMSKAPDATGKVAANDVSSVIQGAAVAEPYAFTLPKYVCVSASGHIIVSDSGSNSVKVFTAQGVYLHSIGSSGSKDGQLKVPYGVCSDQDNNIYVADYYNDRVSVFSIQGEFLQHALTAVSGLCRPKSVAVRPAHVRKLFVAHGGLHTKEILVYRLESTPCYITFKCDL